jgi:transcriptional regulator with XRE-family HTH domain
MDMMAQPRAARDSVTIIDIADAAGVSKSTVSLVLTGRGSVKAETREHVLKVMRDLGYVYNRGAANLRNAQSKIVGLVLNDLSNPFFAEFAIGVETVLQMAGYVAFMANTAESVVRQTQVMRMMREHGAGGIILCPALDTKPEDVAWTSGLDTALLVAIRRLPGAARERGRARQRRRRGAHHAPSPQSRPQAHRLSWRHAFHGRAAGALSRLQRRHGQCRARHRSRAQPRKHADPRRRFFRDGRGARISRPPDRRGLLQRRRRHRRHAGRRQARARRRAATSRSSASTTPARRAMSRPR